MRRLYPMATWLSSIASPFQHLVLVDCAHLAQLAHLKLAAL
jgi:hypothetical protein